MVAIVVVVGVAIVVVVAIVAAVAVVVAVAIVVVVVVVVAIVVGVAIVVVVAVGVGVVVGVVVVVGVAVAVAVGVGVGVGVAVAIVVGVAVVHVTHKPNEIPWTEINASQIEAGKLKRKIMSTFDEDVKAVSGSMDENEFAAFVNLISSELSEKVYFAALVSMKEHYRMIKVNWELDKRNTQNLGTILKAAIQLAIEAETQRQVDDS